MEMKSYTIPTEGESWAVPGDGFTTVFDWHYANRREKMENLYRKGKRLQWDSEVRIDWDRDIDPDNPLGVPDEFVPISQSTPTRPAPRTRQRPPRSSRSFASGSAPEPEEHYIWGLPGRRNTNSCVFCLTAATGMS